MYCRTHFKIIEKKHYEEKKSNVRTWMKLYMRNT